MIESGVFPQWSFSGVTFLLSVGNKKRQDIHFKFLVDDLFVIAKGRMYTESHVVITIAKRQEMIVSVPEINMGRRKLLHTHNA